jgi:hypothetical protein
MQRRIQIQQRQRNSSGAQLRHTDPAPLPPLTHARGSGRPSSGHTGRPDLHGDGDGGGGAQVAVLAGS